MKGMKPFIECFKFRLIFSFMTKSYFTNYDKRRNQHPRHAAWIYHFWAQFTRFPWLFKEFTPSTATRFIDDRLKNVQQQFSFNNGTDSNVHCSSKAFSIRALLYGQGEWAPFRRWCTWEQTFDSCAQFCQSSGRRQNNASTNAEAKHSHSSQCPETHLWF